MTDEDDRSFWRKIRRFAFKAGRKVVEKALILYFCLRDPDTPVWARTVVVGALAYFVFPFDAIPDLLPGVGFTDDLGVLVTALATVAVHVKPSHMQRAREILEWKWAQKPAGGRGRPSPEPGPPKDPHAHYAAVLGVAPGCEARAIRDAYLDRVKKYHPDRVQHLGEEFREMAEQKLKAINEAYAYFKARYPDLP